VRLARSEGGCPADQAGGRFSDPEERARTAAT
jgi:hypothetical protein